ncbi:unnamed protein product [Acanthoscelides obtectus]|uniref:Uncharacterized protein n=1 Tax=Acanthoscelides obtectus TaxID=200917 RepID=A0A9P0KE39_ACAOB|nr:unnamed protein product [Acanthoscelides obtectus]CAK1646944.1 hypothetical protein AOBTE_LOCUS14963 [Acanthoscelides obtectus]
MSRHYHQRCSRVAVFSQYQLATNSLKN